jgi:putative inorganic carbon (HCO3(-)) transporter
MLMVVLVMVVLVPILASPANPQMQGFANYTLRLMAALLACIMVLRARLATRRGEVATFLATGANLAVLLFLADTFVSVLMAPREILSYSLVAAIQTVTGALLYFALAYHVRRSEHLVKILDALVLVSGLMAILGLASIVTQSADPRATLFGDHQLFGAFLMILFPVTLIAAVTERDTKRAVAAQIGAALTFICLLMTGTRTAWLGGMAELIALPLLSLIGSRNKNRIVQRKQQYFIPILIVVVCAGGFAALGGFGGLLAARWSAESKSVSIAYRQRMWYAAEEMIKQKPVFGHGLGSFAFLQNQFSQFGRPPDAVMMNGPTLSENAHSFWLQTAAEQGLVGVSLFAAIVLTFFVSGVRRLRFLEGGVRRSLLLASLAAILGFTIDAIGNPAWQYAQVSMFFWLILGLGVACMRPRAPRQDSQA